MPHALDRASVYVNGRHCTCFVCHPFVTSTAAEALFSRACIEMVEDCFGAQKPLGLTKRVFRGHLKVVGRVRRREAIARVPLSIDSRFPTGFYVSGRNAVADLVVF